MWTRRTVIWALGIISILIAGIAAAESPRQIRKEAAGLLESGEFRSAFLVARPILDRPYSFSSRKELDRIVELFTKEYPTSVPSVIEVISDEINEIQSKAEVTVLLNRLDHYWDIRLLTLDQKHQQQAFLSRHVTKMYEERALNFSLIDDLRWVSEKDQVRVYADAFVHSLDRLAGSEEHVTLLDEVISYVQTQGKESSAYKDFRARIDTIKLPVRYLYEEIGAIYPDYAKSQLELIGPWKTPEDYDALRQLLIDFSALKDPFSVQFRRTYYKHDRRLGREIWCGHYNAKNSWGAYGGWGRFLVISESSAKEPTIRFADKDDTTSASLIDATCFGTEISDLNPEPKGHVSALSGDSLHPGLKGALFELFGDSIEIVSVSPQSPAEDNDLRTGDRITAANRRPISSVSEFEEIAKSNPVLFLLIQRGDRSLMLQVR